MKKKNLMGVVLPFIFGLVTTTVVKEQGKSEVTLENIEAIAGGEEGGEEYWCLVTWQCTGIDARYLSCAGKECSSGNFAGGYVECDGNRQTCCM